VLSADEKVRLVNRDLKVDVEISIGEFALGGGWISDDMLVVATRKKHLLGVSFSTKAVAWSVDLRAEPTSVAVSAAAELIAVAFENTSQNFNEQGRVVQVFKHAKGVVEPVAEFNKHKGDVTAMAFSPNGKLLASGDADRKLFVCPTEEFEPLPCSTSWTNHTARIQCICWLDDVRFATGALDRNVHVWDTADPKSRTKLELAHQGGVAGLACLSTAAPFHIGTCGPDGTKMWTLVPAGAPAAKAAAPPPVAGAYPSASTAKTGATGPGTNLFF
jgi:WD40 repeat protein